MFIFRTCLYRRIRTYLYLERIYILERVYIDVLKRIYIRTYLYLKRIYIDVLKRIYINILECIYI